MNGRLVLLLSLVALAAVLLLAGDDLGVPIQRLLGLEEERPPLDAGDLLEAEGVQGGPGLEGRGPPSLPRASDRASEGRASDAPSTGPLQSRARGMLRFADGVAAGGVQVRLVGAAGTFEFRTNADGSFSHAVPVGVYRATFVAEGVGALVVPSLVVDGASTSGDAIPAFALAETVEVDVLVRSAQKAEDSAAAPAPAPVVGIEVELRPVDARLAAFTRRATTGGAGLALFTDVLQGRSEIIVPMGRTTRALHVVDVRKEQRTVDIHLPQTLTLRGSVRYAPGGPGVERARVAIEVAAERGETRYRTELTTTYDGTFEVEVPRGRGLSLEIQAEGFARWPATNQDNVLAMQTLGRLRGAGPVVLDATLAQGIRVQGAFRPAPGVVPPREPLPFQLTGPAFVINEHTDVGGVFEVPDLMPGRYLLQLRDGAWSARALNFELRAASAPVFDLGDVEIRPARVLQGRVLDASGAPVVGARVWFDRNTSEAGGASEDGGPAMAFSDTSGVWLLPDVPRGTFVTLRASLGDRVAPPRLVQPREEGPIDLRLQEPARIQGVVRQIEGDQPIPGIVVRARSRGLEPTTHRVQTDAAGAFAFPPLVPGTWEVVLETEDFLGSPARTVDAKAAEPVVLAWTLDPGLILAGRCVDETGTPVPGVTIYVSGQSRDGFDVTRAVNASLEGRFHVGGLPEGRYSLRALRTGYQPIARSSLTQSDEVLEFVLKR